MMIKRLPELSGIIPLVLFCLVISCKKQVPEETPIIIKADCFPAERRVLIYCIGLKAMLLIGWNYSGGQLL